MHMLLLKIKNRAKKKKKGKELMNAILYITMFIMGTLFGSFYTLAVYRIPRGIDIVKTHSFCPNCNHKLGFWELIPVWSYIALGGKCKECKQKIRPRYFILEILSGLTFVLLAFALKLDVYKLNLKLFFELAFIILYLVAIFLIAGIDKESRKIEKSVLFYAIGISALYIIYLCIVGTSNIYRYMMYLSLIVILLIIDTLNLKHKAKNNYTMSILMLLNVMIIFTSEITTILTIIMTLLIIAIVLIENKIKIHSSKIKLKNEEISSNLRIGFYLCISNVIVFLILLFMKG